VTHTLKTTIAVAREEFLMLWEVLFSASITGKAAALAGEG